MKYLFIPFLSIGLVSCGSQDMTRPFIDTTLHTGTNQILNTGIKISNNDPKESQFKTTEVAPNKSYTGVIPEIKKLPLVTNIEGTDIESIKAIKTIEQLKAISPQIASLTGYERPGYVELQKDQMILGLYISQIQDPEFLRLQNEKRDIYQGKSIWTPELEKADKDLSEAFLNQSTSAPEQVDIPLLIQKRNDAMKVFQSSPEYQEYIGRSQSKAMEIDRAIKVYWTPEMIQLDKEIQNLTKEIYQTGS